MREWVGCSALGADLAFAGSQPDHAFPETDGSGRSQKDTKAPPFEFRPPPGSRQDTRGHATETVLDREAPGSNPGPPTNFEFEIADSGRHPQSAGHSRGTDSWRTSQRGCEVCRDSRPI